MTVFAGCNTAAASLSALVLLAGTTAAVAAKTDPSTIVTTSAGRLVGVEDGDVTVFRGVPFAAPPLGNFRWRAPQPVAPWTTVREAKSFGHDCMQTPFPGDEAPLRTSPDEDCLYLNVWKPAGARKNAKLPVLVWIYGGAFITGGTSPAIYDGSAFARQGVLFVSFNYRVGRFGFFSHPALSQEQGPVGNFAVSDQVAALAWIRNNIAAFGGDPAKVTLIGESAGGTSVINMLTVPSARGLFRGAIAMSGGGRSLLPTTALATGEQIGVNFAHREGIEGADSAALTALRKLPAATVQGTNLFADRFAVPSTYVGGYVAEGKVVTLPSDTMMEAADMARVPVMIGWTGADTGLSFAQDKDQLFASFGEHGAAMRAAYDPDGTRTFSPLRDEITRDQYMAEPARFVARNTVKAGSRAFVYRFGYVAQTMRTIWAQGAPHATDIPYFLDTVAARYGAQTTTQDRAAASLANRYVVNFVKTGRPGGPGLPKWTAYKKGSEAMLDFSMNADAASLRNPSTVKLDVVEATSHIPAK